MTSVTEKDEKCAGRGDFKVTDKAGVKQLLKSQGVGTLRISPVN